MTNVRLTPDAHPAQIEKTLRYECHAALMRDFREARLLDLEPVEIQGVRIRPIDFTSRIILPQWKLEEGEEEFTVMQVTIAGVTREGGRQTVTYHLLDRTDQKTGSTSMARTTGYPAAACAHLVADGRFKRPGVSAPEHIGADPACYFLKHVDDITWLRADNGRNPSFKDTGLFGCDFLDRWRQQFGMIQRDRCNH